MKRIEQSDFTNLPIFVINVDDRFSSIVMAGLSPRHNWLLESRMRMKMWQLFTAIDESTHPQNTREIAR